MQIYIYFIFIEKYIYFIFKEAEDVYTLRKAVN